MGFDRALEEARESVEQIQMQNGLNEKDIVDLLKMLIGEWEAEEAGKEK